jgi:hypothetical protein
MNSVGTIVAANSLNTGCPSRPGAHDLAAHRALLMAEYVLDTGAHL